jgi:hypothetical protein
MESFKLVLAGDTSKEWDAAAELRFATEVEAKEYAHFLGPRWGLAATHLQAQSTSDPVNCKFTGGIGAKHLVMIDPENNAKHS